MNDAAGTATPQRKSYSTPTVTIRPLSFLAELAWKSNAVHGVPGGNGIATNEAPVRTLIVEGFEQQPADVVRVLLSIDGETRAIPERGVGSVAKVQERATIVTNDGISILLADMRGGASAPVSPVTRIELDGGPRATLILVLSESIQTANGLAEGNAPTDWRIRGPITPEGLGVVIRSMLQLRAMRRDPLRSQAKA